MMNARDKMLARLDQLTDEQIETLFAYSDMLLSIPAQEPYDPDNDPAIGFLSGSTDLATKAKEILRDEITSRSGWTQKKDET